MASLTSILWAIVGIVLLTVAVVGDAGDAGLQVATAGELHDILQELGPATHFRSSSKNIMFGATMGASSHHSWVMRVLDELNQRGHKITYATTESSLRFSRQRPHINGISIGPMHINTHGSMYQTMTPMPFDVIDQIVATTARHYPQNYHAFREVIESESIDVVICDHIAFACFDAAKETKRPLIITTMINESPETISPYINKNPFNMIESSSEHLSYGRRFYERFVWPVQLLWHAGPSMGRYMYTLHSLGLSLQLQERWADALKLVNNLYGFDDPRPMGPLVEHVGPIYNDHFDALTPELALFLGTHQRVVYVAFGQHTQSKSYDESTRVLQMLLNNYEAGVLDGFIWSATDGTPLPKTVATLSGNEYHLGSAAFERVGRVVSWAPQMAILRHPAVVTFVSHAGVMSLYEAAYHGKRILAYPFMTDQFPNAKLIERTGAGLWLTHTEDRLDAARMTDKLRRVVEDKDGSMQAAIQRYQALVQIHGSGAVSRAANLVEEVLFTADSDGHLPHRRDIARNLSFLKRNDYDLYLGLLLVLAATTLSARYAVRSLMTKTVRAKLKTQ